MRDQAVATALDLFDTDPRVAIVLGGISTESFRPAFDRDPARATNVGVMEQTMVGVAAGFAMEGFHPFVHTIAPFLVDRPFEQLKIDFGYQRLGGTFVSVGASYDYATDGPTHLAPGDVPALATIPGFEILVPGHPQEVDLLIRETYANGRPTYVRTSKAQNARPFLVRPGRMEIVREGDQATVVAVGPMLDRTLAAALGLDVTVLYASSVVPLDSQTLAQVVDDRTPVIVVEPYHEGPLALAVAQSLPYKALRVASIGVPLRFLEGYGVPEDHDRHLGLDATGIRKRLVRLIYGQ